MATRHEQIQPRLTPGAPDADMEATSPVAVWDRRYLRALTPGLLGGLAAAALEIPHFVGQSLRSTAPLPSAAIALGACLAFASGVGLAFGLLAEAVLHLLLGGDAPPPLRDGSHAASACRRQVGLHLVAGMVSVVGLAYALARLQPRVAGLFANKVAASLILILTAVAPAVIVHFATKRLLAKMVSRLRHIRRVTLAVTIAGFLLSWAVLDGAFQDAHYITRTALSFEVFLFTFVVVWLKPSRGARWIAMFSGGVLLLLTAGLIIRGLSPTTRHLLLNSGGMLEGYVLRLPSIHTSQRITRLRAAIASASETRAITDGRRSTDDLIRIIPGGPAPQPDIILLSIDSLRPDRLGCYGATNTHAPQLDQFAASASVFLSAFTSAPLTVPSITQMMTGRYMHQIRHVHLDSSSSYIVAPDVGTLGSWLRDRGYVTRAIVEGMLLGGFPFMGYGFNRIQDGSTLARPLSTRDILREIAQALAKDSAAPQFFWTHLISLHNRNREALTSLDGVAAYDAAVELIDADVGRFLSDLELLPRGRNAVIVITADHGENLGEDGLYYHGFMAPMTMWIPLIIRFPAQAPQRVSSAVSLLDLAPTILAAAGVAAQGLPGQDLRMPPQPTPSWPGRPAFHENMSVADRSVVAEVGVTAPPWQLLYNYRHDTVTLVNLAEDPRGERDRAGHGLPQEDKLLELLTGFFEDHP